MDVSDSQASVGGDNDGREMELALATAATKPVLADGSDATAAPPIRRR
jgi:hypothetical protein